jgi:hypothetical protein
MSPTATLFFIACIALSCKTYDEKSPKELIIQLLDRRQRGLEENNPRLYLSTISPNYNDGIDNYATLSAKAERYKQVTFRIIIENRSIYISKNRATVIEEYHLSGSLPSGRKLDIKRQGVLRLEYDEAHGWKIVNGINDFSFPN